MGILARVILESHLRKAQKAVQTEEAEGKSEKCVSKVVEVEISWQRESTSFIDDSRCPTLISNASKCINSTASHTQ